MWFASFLQHLDRQPKGRLWIAALIGVGLLGILDYLSGFEVSFAFFYLLPVSLVAWAVGRWAGNVLSLFSAAAWLLANLAAGEHFSSVAIPFWNALTRFGFFVVVTWLIAELRRHLDIERALARTDHLTGLLNSRAFHEVVTAELGRADRLQHPLTLVHLDLDGFKSVNDQRGHSGGDLLLQVVGRSLVCNLRAVDAVARLGGDEFAMLLPAVDSEGARVVTARLQQALLAEMRRNHWQVTFSMGVLTCGWPPPQVSEMITLADELMYSVKKAGKNAVAYAAREGRPSSPRPRTAMSP